MTVGTGDIAKSYANGAAEYVGGEYEDHEAQFHEWLRAERARIWDEGYDANDAGPQRLNPYE